MQLADVGVEASDSRSRSSATMESGGTSARTCAGLARSTSRSCSCPSTSCIARRLRHERRRPRQPQLAGQLERVAQPLGGDADSVHAFDDEDGARLGDRARESARTIDHAAGQAAAFPVRQATVAAPRRQIEILDQIGEPRQEATRPSWIDGRAQVVEGRAPPLRQMGAQRHDGRSAARPRARVVNSTDGDVELAHRPERGGQALQSTPQPFAAPRRDVDDDRQRSRAAGGSRRAPDGSRVRRRRAPPRDARPAPRRGGRGSRPAACARRRRRSPGASVRRRRLAVEVVRMSGCPARHRYHGPPCAWPQSTSAPTPCT